MKTKAAILVEQRAPLVVEELELPALAWGQALVRVRFSGVCGSQIGEIDGVKGPDRFLPHLLGHEGGGEVMETGPGVTRVRSGDAVVLHWRRSGGIESPTPRYRWGGRDVNAGWVTTFNELAVVSENRLTAVPAGTDLRVAALYGCALTTGFGIVSRDARLGIGESIVVYGAGGVGLCVVIGARLAGANPIVAVDLQPHKLRVAESLGATHVLDGADPHLETKLKEILGPAGADVACDTTGSPRVIEAAYAATSPSGRTVLAGVTRHDEKVSIYSLPLHFGKVLTGSHGGGSDPGADVPRYMALERAGRFDPSALISHEFALEEINQAVDTTRRGEALRCIVRP